MSVINVYLSRHEDVKNLAKRIGKDIGSLDLLTTDDKENIVAAINELKQAQSDITGRIEVLEEYHKPVEQGPASEYPGTGWYKATDTGVVYSRGVPHGETHTFEGDPVEYIALSDAGLDPTVHGADFQHVLKDFQANLHRYAISDVTDLSYALNAYNNSVFGYDEEFKEVDLSHWDTSSVTKTIATFATVKNTRIKGLENWDMSKVENMNYMFMDSEAAEFSDISGWDTSSVNSMEAMFQRAASFNQDLSQWCVPLITTAPERFDSKASSWTLPKPVWGTCPRGEDKA